jgi:hypothetical protein
MNGRDQEERTFPDSWDPKRSPGRLLHRPSQRELDAFLARGMATVDSGSTRSAIGTGTPRVGGVLRDSKVRPAAELATQDGLSRSAGLAIVLQVRAWRSMQLLDVGRLEGTMP